MSRTNELLEAQLATSFHDELLLLEKRANVVVAGGKAAVKGGKLIPKVVKGIKGSKTLAKYGPKAWLKFTKSLPGRVAYRLTGYKGSGWSKLTKAQQAERMRSWGVRGVEGVEGAKKKMLGESDKILQGDGFLKGKAKRNLEALKTQHGGLSKASPEELAKALGSHGDTLLAEGQAYEKGITSVPGYVREAVKNPLGTARLGWRTEGTMGKTMTAGFGGLGAYNVATAAPEDRLKVLAEEVPSTALYAVTGPTGMLGQLALADVPTSIASSAAKRVQSARSKAKLTPKLVQKAKAMSSTPAQPVQAIKTTVGDVAADAVHAATPGLTRPTSRAQTLTRAINHVQPQLGRVAPRVTPNPAPRVAPRVTPNPAPRVGALRPAPIGV